MSCSRRKIHASGCYTAISTASMASRTYTITRKYPHMSYSEKNEGDNLNIAAFANAIEKTGMKITTVGELAAERIVRTHDINGFSYSFGNRAQRRAADAADRHSQRVGK